MHQMQDKQADLKVNEEKVINISTARSQSTCLTHGWRHDTMPTTSYASSDEALCNHTTRSTKDTNFLTLGSNWSKEPHPCMDIDGT